MEYLSLKKKEYIYKSDLCLMFDYDGIFPEVAWQTSAVDWILNECWTKMDYGDHYEMMVKPDMAKTVEEIMNTLNQQAAVMKTFNTLTKVKFYENVSEKLKQHTVMSDVILACMEEIIEKYPVRKYSAELSRILAWVGLVMEAIENYVEKESIHLPPINSVSLTKPVIRLFSIDKNHFVMADELLKTLKNCNIDVSGFEKNVFGMKELSTFTFREASQKVDKDVMKNLEFVKMEDIRLIFAQTPIPTCNGGYCTLAVDALRDILMDMILAKKIFQTIEEKNWIYIKQFFKSIEKYFDRTRGVYFIDLKDVKTIKELWENVYDTHLEQSSPSPKLMKTSKKTGFSVKDLKETLPFLELEKCFKGIFEYADPIYSILTADNKLSTNHLHIAVLQCQINSLVRKIPMLLEFIHKQGGCDRLSIVRCELCDGKTLAEESVTITKPQRPETREELHQKKTKHQSSIDTKSESEALNSEVAKSDVTIEKPTTEEKPSQKTKESKKSKQPTSREIPKPEPKESNACPKCERAGKFTREANEKLRLSKIEVKQLKKDLIRNQLKNEEMKQKVMDKDERIRMLERLLEEKDDVIKEQEEKMKEQAAVIQELRRVE
ncbi:hypothetical protein CRE_17608 [Caenorhabditis remanei]|uniref:Uncharacterized protein n=1 Tax=Caenorhabditis remanei TaxID=31234 RepID=E3NHA5_CAERE|nr:hypothetical protein CRE_17608 [Caenorhabditis remanei]